VRPYLRQIRKLNRVSCLAAAALMIAAAIPARAQEFTKYHNYAELTAALQNMAAAHKDIAKLSSIGKTAGGRDIWLLEIANPAGVPVKDRPGVLVAANFEADHLIGSEIALVVADTLLKGYPADAETKARLDNSVISIIPRLNADGAEGMFGAVKAGRRTNLAPRDEDNDGRVDEDGPEDLNKDGFITLMRVKASDGEYMIDPEEPRLMKKADPKKGEAGVYKIYWEGLDKDKDGFFGEDPVGGTDLNRNFMHDYPYYTPDAGPYMVSEKESQALMAWIAAHKNVGAILTFGESDNLIAPPSGGRPGSSRELDLVRFADASNAASRTVGMIQTGMGGFGGFGRFMGGEFSFEMMSEFMRGQRGSQRAQAQTQAGGRFRMPDRKAPTAVVPGDQDYFKAISDKYVETTGIRQALYVREPQGAFYQYGYFQFGVPSFSTPGFGLATAESRFPGRMGQMSPMGQAEAATGGQAGGQRAAGGPPTGDAASGGARQQITVVQGGPEGFQVMQAGPGGMGRGLQAGGAGGSGAAGAPGIDKQVLKWMDAEKIDGFVKWTPFKHPELGDVEIGGFKPYAVTNPPAAKIAGLGAGHTKFVLYLASILPKVKIIKFEATSHGGGIYRLRAEVENTGFLPTALAQAVTAQGPRSTMVQLQVKPEDILSGNVKTNFIPSLPGSGNGATKYEWVIQGKSGQAVELKLVSERGGADSARVTLK
jgi:murein tripeptide amidase MpaA